MQYLRRLDGTSFCARLCRQLRRFSDRTAFALHILDEVIDHAAEVSLMRHRYSVQSVDHLKASALNGEIDPATIGELKVRLADSSLKPLVPESGMPPSLVDAGFDVNAERSATAFHHPAGTGLADLVPPTAHSGADRDVLDDAVPRGTGHVQAPRWTQGIDADWASVIEMRAVAQDRPTET